MGYEESIAYSEGFISCLKQQKLINTSESNILKKIYVHHTPTSDDLATRYKINSKGQVEDFEDKKNIVFLN